MRTRTCSASCWATARRCPSRRAGWRSARGRCARRLLRSFAAALQTSLPVPTGRARLRAWPAPAQPVQQASAFKGQPGGAQTSDLRAPVLASACALQSIMLVELDGARPRTVGVQIVGQRSPTDS